MTKTERKFYELGRMMGHLQSREAINNIKFIDETSYYNDEEQKELCGIGIEVMMGKKGPFEKRGEHHEW